MRLINADYVIEKLNEINGTAELDKAFEVVENAPTVDMLDKIRAEIEQEISNASSVDYINGLNVALMIINEKYR